MMTNGATASRAELMDYVHAYAIVSGKMRRYQDEMSTRGLKKSVRIMQYLTKRATEVSA